MANYALSAIIAAAVRARILEVRGPWFDGRSGLVPVRRPTRCSRRARRARPADLLEPFLGGPLTAEPLLADLAAPARRPIRRGMSTSASIATARNSRLR